MFTMLRAFFVHALTHAFCIFRDVKNHVLRIVYQANKGNAHAQLHCYGMSEYTVKNIVVFRIEGELICLNSNVWVVYLYKESFLD